MIRRRSFCLAAAVTAAFASLAVVTPLSAQTPSSDGDDQITGQRYVRHDGGSDTGIAHCNNTASDPAGDNDLTDADVDSNDGGSRRQGNEPYTVIDPTDPSHVFAGWNDYCLTDLGAGWQGFAFSLDGGETWTDSIVPGYPQDTSAEGMASPLFRTHTDAGDPIAAFDNDGNLFVGGISFNRVKPANGDVYVATYGTNPTPSGYPVDYLRTVVVGRGTPSPLQGGIFQDKPMLEVDRTGGPNDGNVYVCWSRFTANGQNKVYFSRSTDSGASFSQPITISRSEEIKSIQGCDIAIEGDGDVYVTFRTFTQNRNQVAGLGFVRSSNGGVTFSRARLITSITVYNPFDAGRNCGDGPLHCPSDLVFHRVPLEPRVTADQTGELAGVWLTYNAVAPATIVPSDPAKARSYFSAGPGRVGQSVVYVARSVNNGATWGIAPVEAAPQGHQFFADIDAHAGELGVMWQDNRGPTYDVQYPVGNTRDAQGRAVSAGRQIMNTFLASWTGTGWSPAQRMSTMGHQSQYEMFSSRDLPFHGDYNWISLAERSDGSVIGYMSWTDNRNVVQGPDPRETQAQGGFDDGFDVLQCRIDLGAPAPPATLPGVPLFRSDAPFTGDNCGNAGGLNQDIFGIGVTFD
jgi:hypothetical protein